MKQNYRLRLALALAIPSLLFCAPAIAVEPGAAGGVEILRTPNEGVLPRAVVGNDGTLHLLYFKLGAERKGNLFYVTRQRKDAEWSEPTRVNATVDGVPRMSSIGLPQIALGKNGRIHATWFEMRGGKYWYTRLNDAGIAFEPERNLATEFNKGVEASAALASDRNGHVSVVWHAGAFADESARGIYATRSTDDGETWDAVTKVNPGDAGVCGCCGLGATIDSAGTLYISYRAAGNNVDRDMTLLKSTDFGQSFTGETFDRWNVNTCPVSTTSFAEGPESAKWVAWERKERVYFANVAALSEVMRIENPTAPVRQKNPSIAVNRSGSMLIAWGEGDGWESGGTLRWQTFDSEGNPTGQSGQSGEIPELSVAEAVALPDGSFVLLY